MFRASVLCLALALAGCASATPDRTEGPRVVVTTTILGDIVRGVVGDAGSVEVLMDAGQDPHAFAASARQAQAIRQADLVVANGLGLEAPLEDVLEAAEQDGVEVLRVAPELDPLSFGDGHEEAELAEDEAEHGHEDDDPHVWFDPVRMARVPALVADALPPGGPWPARAEEVTQAIREAHGAAEAVLGTVPPDCRKLVTNHDNLGYLAVRYGFEVVGTVIPGSSTQAEPNPRDIAQLAETLRREGVTAIFTESFGSERIAAALAAEVGEDVEIVALHTDSLGGPGSGADSYPALISTNARRIADALEGC